MFRRIVFLALVALPCFASAAAAQEYIKPTWPELIRTLIRMSAIDISDQIVLDEYGIATECEMYDTFYGNDFKWNKVRKALRASIRKNIATYPTRYRHDIEMQLDRYDFSTGTFLFRDKSRLANDNVIQLYSVPINSCHMDKVKNVPLNFIVVLHPPLYLEGISMPERDAQGLVMRMERDDNNDRIIHASYNLKIAYIEPLRKEKIRDGVYIYKQAKVSPSLVRLDAQVESIDFYEDPQRTRLIYHMQM